MTSPTLDLACELIRRPSVSPRDEGCQELIAERLRPLGFGIEWMSSGEVTNLWARRGSEGPLFCFAGHTDVVPSGPEEQWSSPPFTPTIRDGWLHGRGASDMKGSVAAMVTATESFLAAHPDHQGSIAFLLTSDEEGPATEGTIEVIRRLSARGEQITHALVGEPSSHQRLGDEIKNGRRGSLNGTLTVHGKQGHVAYPQRALNPFHACAPALAALCAEVWDQGNEFFPPTSFQISNLHMGTGAENVIPGELQARFNLRFSTELTAERIRQRVRELLDEAGIDYDLEWRLSGVPFLTASGDLVTAARQAISTVTGQQTRLSTSGGTSDGRFIAPTGAEVIELGPVNATIHQVDERVGVQELDELTRIYELTLEQLLVHQAGHSPDC